MKSGIFILVALLHLASAFNNKVLLFPEKSDTAYARLVPDKPLNLHAFTLCMRVSSEQDSAREMILFAYCTQEGDELNIWQEKGRYSLYLRSSSHGVLFSLTPLSVFPTHLCVTWTSDTGATAFWLNGRRSMLKTYQRGFHVNSQGAVLLGQDPDSFVGKFDKEQSFVGEITDVHMWDEVLTASQIQQLADKQENARHGNVINWNTVRYQIYGKVEHVPDPGV